MAQGLGLGAEVAAPIRERLLGRAHHGVQARPVHVVVKEDVIQRVTPASSLGQEQSFTLNGVDGGGNGDFIARPRGQFGFVARLAHVRVRIVSQVAHRAHRHRFAVDHDFDLAAEVAVKARPGTTPGFAHVGGQGFFGHRHLVLGLGGPLVQSKSVILQHGVVGHELRHIKAAQPGGEPGFDLAGPDALLGEVADGGLSLFVAGVRGQAAIGVGAHGRHVRHQVVQAIDQRTGAMSLRGIGRQRVAAVNAFLVQLGF